LVLDVVGVRAHRGARWRASLVPRRERDLALGLSTKMPRTRGPVCARRLNRRRSCGPRFRARRSPAAAAATISAAAAAARRTLLGLVDLERTAVEHRAVHGGDGAGRLVRRAHRDEAEAARTAALAIGDDVDVGHGAVLGESFADGVVLRVERKVTDIETSAGHGVYRNRPAQISALSTRRRRIR